jgi:uncharacterized membrane protein
LPLLLLLRLLVLLLQSMIQLSRTQDEEVGDGTTSVIILAGELLQVRCCFSEVKLLLRL